MQNAAIYGERQRDMSGGGAGFTVTPQLACAYWTCVS
jgi:hypothetical protein